MEYLISINKNGNMAVKNSAGITQYVAKYDNLNHQGKIYDDLEITELVSVKRNDMDFSLIAFDSPMGDFILQSDNFHYICEQENCEIKQEGSSFVFYKNSASIGTLTNEGNNFKLSLDTDDNILINIAEVIMVIAAKSYKNSLKIITKNGTSNESAKPQNTKEESIFKAIKTPEFIKKAFDFIKEKGRYLYQKAVRAVGPLLEKLPELKSKTKTIKSFFWASIGGFIISLIAVISFAAAINAHSSYSEAEAICKAKNKAEFSTGFSTYAFEVDDDVKIKDTFKIWYKDSENQQVEYRTFLPAKGLLIFFLILFSFSTIASVLLLIYTSHSLGYFEKIINLTKK